jgi:hypothetical protein
VPRVPLVVDAANVVGSRPDGWWRDRAGAAARLVASLRAALAAGRLEGTVVVVLEGAARGGAPEDVTVDLGRDADGVVVRHAPGAGDDALVAEVATAVAGGTDALLVTADRGLRARAESVGATVVGPSWLLDRLDGGGDQ